jgi:hypothetical protein
MSGEVHLVLLSVSSDDLDGPRLDRRATLTPATYDLELGPLMGVTPMAAPDVPADLNDFVRTVVSDLDALSTALVMNYAKQWVLKRDNPSAQTAFSAEREAPRLSDLYAHLLVGFADNPPELISNMLAALLASYITPLADDPRFGEIYDAWETSFLEAPAADPNGQRNLNDG